jgi:3-oxoacyl-[acyl-carrier protein] reductase
MDLGLKGKVAVVAGGSAGLGLATARALAQEGASVSIAARNSERLESAVEELRTLDGGAVMGRALDVRDEKAVQQWVADTVDEIGAVHIVVANAGGPPVGTATELTSQDYRDALELNLTSSITLCEAAVPHLRQAGWGRVLFITSMSAKIPAPRLALSNVTRAGVLGYAKSLMYDVAKDGITVNVLAPGFTRTSRFQQVFSTPEEQKKLAAEQIPLGRVAEPAEFGAVAAFLAGQPAAYVTGTVMQVDGGWAGSLF